MSNESGSTFIRLGGDLDVDMYVEHDTRCAPDADLDFIAAARNYRRDWWRKSEGDGLRE